MIIYFDLQPEYRKRLADLLDSHESELETFFESLESELAWHLALGGLRESALSDEEILRQIKEVNKTVAALDEAMEGMSPDVFGWLIDHAPIGLDYQLPFRAIRKPAKIIRSMTAKAIRGFKGRDVTARRSSSTDFIRKIAYCCEKNFGSRPDLQSDFFYNLVDILFQSLAIAEHKDIKKLINEVMQPPAVVLAENTVAQSVAPAIPKNYFKGQK